MAVSNIPASCFFETQKLQSLLFFFLLLLHPAISISFNFTSFSKDNIALELDAKIDPTDQQGRIQLTELTYFSAGRALYNKPVHLSDNSAGRRIVTDFTTRFSFIIKNTSTPPADGLAFFITPFGYKFADRRKSGGAFLGLFNNETSLDATKNQVVAVEFDTVQNAWDPSGNHVGIDVNSIDSKASVTWPYSFMNGSIVNAQVSYNSSTQNLTAFLTYADNPVFSENSSVSLIVNFTEILNGSEWVSVGISASTGSAVATHTILHWSFDSTLEDGFTQPNETRDGF